MQFNFVHRFRRGGAPEHRISNAPTFLSAIRVPRLPAMVGATYSSNSDVVARMPNEWEFFLRAVPWALGNRFADLSLQVGFNQAARSVDAELGLARRLGPARLFAAARTFTHAFDQEEPRHALAGGLALQLVRQVAVAGDAATLLDRGETERVAWSAGVQLGVPSSPHSLSLHVTNVTTNTLEGASRGAPQRRIGFEYTVPISFARYTTVADRQPASGGLPGAASSGGQAAARDTVFARIQDFAYEPATLEIEAGTLVVWTNEDPAAHTVTADDRRSFDSGLLASGGRWSFRFDQPGSYAFHCEPHPYMQGTVVVR
jgi:plastocyanin